MCDNSSASSQRHKLKDNLVIVLDSNVATVTITVNAVNDAPLVKAGPVDYGDGSGVQPLPLADNTFTLLPTRVHRRQFDAPVGTNGVCDVRCRDQRNRPWYRLGGRRVLIETFQASAI